MDSLGAKNPDNGIPPTDSDLLRQYLAERDVSCPGCGYNLRGLAAGACPECNQDFELGIKLASPRIGRLVAVPSGRKVRVSAVPSRTGWAPYRIVRPSDIRVTPAATPSTPPGKRSPIRSTGVIGSSIPRRISRLRRP